MFLYYIMNKMNTRCREDNPLISDYLCKLCNIYYRDSSHKKRHEITKKHAHNLQKWSEANEADRKIDTSGRYACKECNRKYKYLSGLSKHNTKYHPCEQEEIANTTLQTSNEMMVIMKEILKTQLNILSKQQENHSQVYEQHNTFNNQGIYINKSIVNVNVFLNEYCNNAISLMDFMNNLNLTLDDLKETKSRGYVDGVSNILVRKLVSLKPTERPIHCDEKNKDEFDFYVKEESNWMKDIGNKKIDWSIENISKKQIEMLHIWEKAHPTWMNSDKETDTYLEMVKLCMGGSSHDEMEKNKRAIKKAIASGVKIEDIINYRE